MEGGPGGAGGQGRLEQEELCPASAAYGCYYWLQVRFLLLLLLPRLLLLLALQPLLPSMDEVLQLVRQLYIHLDHGQAEQFLSRKITNKLVTQIQVGGNQKEQEKEEQEKEEQEKEEAPTPRTLWYSLLRLCPSGPRSCPSPRPSSSPSRPGSSSSIALPSDQGTLLLLLLLLLLLVLLLHILLLLRPLPQSKHRVAAAAARGRAAGPRWSCGARGRAGAERVQDWQDQA